MEKLVKKLALKISLLLITFSNMRILSISEDNKQISHQPHFLQLCLHQLKGDSVVTLKKESVMALTHLSLLIVNHLQEKEEKQLIYKLNKI